MWISLLSGALGILVISLFTVAYTSGQKAQAIEFNTMTNKRLEYKMDEGFRHIHNEQYLFRKEMKSEFRSLRKQMLDNIE